MARTQTANPKKQAETQHYCIGLPHFSQTACRSPQAECNVEYARNCAVNACVIARNCSFPHAAMRSLKTSLFPSGASLGALIERITWRSEPLRSGREKHHREAAVEMQEGMRFAG